MKVQFVSWDWKSQPDVDELGKALQNVYDGQHVPCLTGIPDSQSDSYVVLLSGRAVTGEEAQKIFNIHGFHELGDEAFEIPWP